MRYRDQQRWSVLLRGTRNLTACRALNIACKGTKCEWKKGNPDRFIFLLSFPGEISVLCKVICWVSHCLLVAMKISAFRHSALLIFCHCLKGRFFVTQSFAFIFFFLVPSSSLPLQLEFGWWFFHVFFLFLFFSFPER